jgi:hypothetical protein
LGRQGTFTGVAEHVTDLEHELARLDAELDQLARERTP